MKPGDRPARAGGALRGASEARLLAFQSEAGSGVSRVHGIFKDGPGWGGGEGGPPAERLKAGS